MEELACLAALGLFIAFNATVARDPHVRYVFTDVKGSEMGVLYFSCYVSRIPVVLDADNSGEGVTEN